MSSDSFAMELLKPMLAKALSNGFGNSQQPQQPMQQMVPMQMPQQQWRPRGNRGYGDSQQKGPTLYEQVQEQKGMMQEVLQHLKAQQTQSMVPAAMHSPGGQQQLAIQQMQSTSNGLQLSVQQQPQQTAQFPVGDFQQYFQQLGAQLEHSVNNQIKQLTDELRAKHGKSEQQLQHVCSSLRRELQRANDSIANANDSIAKLEKDLDTQVEAQMLFGEKLRVLMGKLQEPSFSTHLLKRDIAHLQTAVTEMSRQQLTGAAAKRARAVQSLYEDDDDDFGNDVAQAAAAEQEEAEAAKILPQRPTSSTPGTQSRRGTRHAGCSGAGCSTDPIDIGSDGPKKRGNGKAAGKAKMPPPPPVAQPAATADDDDDE